MQEPDQHVLLQALQLLLLNPEFTLPTATICRTALLPVVAALVDEAIASGGAAVGHSPAAVAAAMVQVFLIAPHTEL